MSRREMALRQIDTVMKPRAPGHTEDAVSHVRGGLY
jgi:hypothetical protein